jgi:crossover junction endodeoxyribonuclease RuvC
VNILGIDPGIERTGWGVIRLRKNICEPLGYGCITTDRKKSAEKRLSQLYKDLDIIIKNQKPKEAAIEKLFFNINTKTALSVGQARGVVLLALCQNHVDVSHYSPQEIKISTTGYGKADKRQVQSMIKTLLKLDKIPKPDDVSDALAVALTHAYTKGPKP